MRIMAVESSCDETAVAIVEDGRKVLTDCIASQVDLHRIYGGVVPEIASRKHIEAIYGLADQALQTAGMARQDIDAVVEYIRHRFYGLHVIMIGHSMGSLAARAYLKYHDSGLEGLVICGSPSPNPLAPVGHFFLKLLCRIGGGRVRVGVLQKCISGRYNRRFRHEGPQAWTCSDPNVRMTNAQDPRCNFTLTADCSLTLMELFKEAYSDKGWCPKKPDMPVLFLSGEDDPCMISREKFVKAADLMIHNGYKRVSSRTYTGMRHEILNEVGRISVWRDILDHISELK